MDRLESFLGGQDPNTTLSGGADTEEMLRSLEAPPGGPVEDLGHETAPRYRDHPLTAPPSNSLASKTNCKRRDEAAAKLIATRIPERPEPRFRWRSASTATGSSAASVEVVPAAAKAGTPTRPCNSKSTLYDFGIEPDISPPPESAVFDATPLIKAKLGLDE